MRQTAEPIRQELVKRHRLAVMAIGATMGFSLALMGIGYLHKFPIIPSSYSLAQGLWVAIAMFGLGSIAIRRSRLTTMRLKDIAALRGLSGLLTFLQNTTFMLTLLAAAIVIMGFTNTMMTNDWLHIRNAGVITIGVLLYSYPTRTSWQRVVEGVERDGIAGPARAKGSSD